MLKNVMNVIAVIGFAFWVTLLVGFAVYCLTPVIKDILARLHQ